MSKSSRIQISLAAFFAFTAVALGAVGAHALEERLREGAMMEIWRTAALYHLAHALALFALGIWSEAAGRSPSRNCAAMFWSAGIIFFSGSLYGLALDGPSLLGPVTPLGGLSLLAGWVAVAFGAWRAKGSAR